MEELDDQGQVKSASITETRTTLIAVEDAACVLQVEVTVEVAGKRFVAQPRQVRVNHDGRTNGAGTEFRKVGEATLELGGHAIRCAILESTTNDGDRRVVSRLHYSETVPPYILRREMMSVSDDGKQVFDQILEEALAVQMPQKVLTELQSGAHMRTIQKQPNATTFTLEVVCLDIPGGLVAHTSKHLDASGRPVRHSTLELIDYGIAAPAEAARRGFFFQHSRSRRSQIPTRPRVP